MITPLLQIGQALAIKANLDVPTTLTGNTERTAQVILQCIKDGSLKDAWHDVDWAVLRLEHTFEATGASSTRRNPKIAQVSETTVIVNAKGVRSR